MECSSRPQVTRSGAGYEGSKGFNVAGGIAEMTLSFQPG